MLFVGAAAIDGEDAHGKVFSGAVKVIGDLDGQFACGGYHERAGCAIKFGDVRAVEDAVKERHSKTQGFSLPGAGLSDKINTVEGEGKGEFLNGKGVLDAKAVEGIGNLNGDAELRECRSAALFGHAIILSLPHYDRGKPYHCC